MHAILIHDGFSIGWRTTALFNVRKKDRTKEKSQEGRKRTKANQTRENHRAKYEERLKENVFEKSHP